MIINNVTGTGINKIMKNASRDDVFEYIQQNIDSIMIQLNKESKVKLPFELNNPTVKGLGLELEDLTDTIKSLRLVATNNNQEAKKMIVKGSESEIINAVKEPKFKEILKTGTESLEYYLKLGK